MENDNHRLELIVAGPTVGKAVLRETVEREVQARHGAPVGKATTGPRRSCE